ncbi:hypothetical protein JTB14_005492 [Gonioctena quinquepunctata]|nr:hypothetical protein JTB14_005492 [Gonioctena quinquepunctata]
MNASMSLVYRKLEVDRVEMLRAYTHGKRHRKFRLEVINEARAVVNAGGMSIREASRHYNNLSYSVLSMRIENKHKKKQDGETTLSVAEENILVEKIGYCTGWVYLLDLYSEL